MNDDSTSSSSSSSSCYFKFIFFRAQGKEFIPTIQYQFPLIFQSHSSPQIMIVVVVVVVVVAQMINVNN